MSGVGADEIAKSYLHRSDALREELQIASEQPAVVFLSYLRLAARAFAGLVFKKVTAIAG